MKRSLVIIVLLGIFISTVFAGRYYDPEIGRFTQIDPSWQNYPSHSPYSYCANNPLRYIDPDGRNWFQYDDDWHWHDGDTYTYTDSDGNEHTLNSTYEMLVVYQITGLNSDGAITGNMTVYGEGYSDVKENSSGVFSGGNGFKSISEGDYYMDLSIDNIPLSLVKTGSDYFGNDIWETASIAKGIQYFPKGIIEFNGEYWNVGNEWGQGRIRLYPSRNLYIHGKGLDKNWTHGCVCDKSEKVFFYLMQSQYKGVVPFNVKY